jgi:hypothetical protein
VSESCRRNDLNDRVNGDAAWRRIYAVQIAQEKPMFEVYETYGSRDADLSELREQLSSSLEITFEDHESYYVGEYFLAHGPAGQKITIESNQLEDEDGTFFQEEQFPEYKALVRLEYCAPVPVDGGGPAVDELSRIIRKIEGLALLQREFHDCEV